MPKQHIEHQVQDTDNIVTSARCGLEPTGEQTTFCTHFLRWGGHSLMALVATCSCIHEDHVLPQLCKNPLHHLQCTCHWFNQVRLPHPAFLLYFPSNSSQVAFSNLSQIFSCISVDFIASSQPCLYRSWLASPCVFPRTSPCLSSWSLLFHFLLFLSIQPHTHIHLCNHFLKTLLAHLHTALFCYTVLSIHRQSFHSSNNAGSPRSTHFHSRLHMWHSYTFAWSPDQDLNIDTRLYIKIWT